jgi:outer membrane protein assembly factor BamB
MVALRNKVFVIGSASDHESSRLIALNANTGDILWQYGDANVNVLTVSEDKLFVGELGGGRVTALNPDTGAIEWSSIHIGNVTNLLVRGNILYADTVSDNYYLFDADTGKILKTIPYTLDNTPNPEIPIWSNHHMNLQFIGNVGYFQTPTNYPIDKGDITATDEVSGNQIWNSNLFYAVTQITTSPLGVFVLDSDGGLLRFNPINGVMDKLIQFNPAPTLRDGYSFGYYVAVDSDNQKLFVYLGDSTQLYAFQIQE